MSLDWGPHRSSDQAARELFLLRLQQMAIRHADRGMCWHMPSSDLARVEGFLPFLWGDRKLMSYTHFQFQVLGLGFKEQHEVHDYVQRASNWKPCAICTRAFEEGIVP